MPRLFTAIELPEGIRRHLAMARTGLAGARWIEPDDYHVALRFFGDVDRSQARELVAALAESRSHPFELRIEGLGCFGGDHPRAIWAGVKSEPALGELQRSHERAARMAGLELASRKYTPHVTLARLKRIRPDAVARFLEAFGGITTSPFEVSRFVLLSSQPGTGGGPYVIEDTFAFEEWDSWVESEDDEHFED